MNAIKKSLTSLLLGLVVSSCASLPPAPQPVIVPPPQLAPPPASVMVVRPANFRVRLLQIFSPSQTMPTQ